MNAPHRIQRQRTKGWKMPDDTVYVGRGTKWGNPFIVGDALSIRTFEIPSTDSREAAFGTVTPYIAKHLYEMYLRARVKDNRGGIAELPMAETVVKELRGKNLACWCPLDQPCHADVLLEIAYADEVARA